MAKRSTIPLHYLREETELELYLHRMDGMDPDVTLLMESHRDDHCNFFFQEKGSSRLMVDFWEVRLEGCGVFCILPGQVHRPIFTSGATGWFMATDMATVDEIYRSVFEEYVSYGEPVSLNEDQAVLLGTCMQLLSDFSGQPNTAIFHQPVLRSMAQVCLGMFASFFKTKAPGFSATLRPALITCRFKSLLLENFKIMKSPAEYAHALNITPSYLNEVIKETTAMPREPIDTSGNNYGSKTPFVLYRFERKADCILIGLRGPYLFFPVVQESYTAFRGPVPEQLP